ncbi:DUF2567 domain-containing protein [Nocardia sp. CNY236]|uniref:DUF2567 domain-containing protein n=1 Tax=Nocardia sp. CNY236 TaxID=1169152 RepID=UPI001E658A34|nr:DUF2567 domain-containing protein [Nocardia sp. CNY236]
MAAPSGAPLRRAVREAMVVAAAVVAISALVGVGWGVLAPTEQMLLIAPDRAASMIGESAHRFDALALFVMTGAVLGLLSAVVAWRWRTARGPMMQIGLLIGSGLGALAMARVGEGVAGLLHPRPHDAVVGQLVRLPTEVGSQVALIAQPLLASFVVLLLATLNTSDDLDVASWSTATHSGGRSAANSSVTRKPESVKR